MASLLQLLFGKPVEQFRAEHWPDRPLCVAGSIDRLAELCASPVFADIASFIASHPGRAWLHRHTPEGFDHETTVDAATAVELYEGGSMMDLQDVHHWLPAAKAWLARLHAELGLEQVAQLEHEGYVHAFVSPAGTGAPQHFDNREVIAVQILGRKRWHVSSRPALDMPPMPHVSGAPVHPLNRRAGLVADEPGMPEGSRSYLMEPGSAIFLPRGYWHTTEAVEDSLSLSFGFRIPSWAELIANTLLHELAVIPGWRATAYDTTKVRPPDSERFTRALAGAFAQIRASVPPPQRRAAPPGPGDATEPLESSDRLVLSRHVSFLPLAPGLIACGHAFRGPRNVVDEAQRAQLEAFREPTAIEAYARRHAADDAARAELVAQLRAWQRQGLLVPVDEDAALAGELGRDVEAVKAGIRRSRMRSHHDPRVRFPLRPARGVAAPAASWKVVYLGLCLALPAMDALLELAASHGLDIQGWGSFPGDHALIEEAHPDFVVIGDLPRVGLAWRDDRPIDYVEALRASIREIRKRTAVPILVHDLIVPTCSPAGLAERGADSHVNRVRATNLAIADLAAGLDEVYVVDLDQVAAFAGKDGLVDDAVLPSHHLASLTWLVERARREPLAATAHDLSQLLHGAGAPRERLELEYLIAAEDLRVMCAIRGHGRRKVIAVDLDDTLWPGVIADSGAPFPPELAVDAYPHHLYLGLHEALLALRDRGCLLVCLSKNDEAVVRALWRYPSTLDGVARLTLDDFVTHRIDWNDKADNLAAIADELGLPLASFAVIDDSPRERDNIRARFPEVMVLGDNPFAVRRQLLTDPAFQVTAITREAQRRSTTVRGQLARERQRAGAGDPVRFRASLEMRCTVQRERDEANLARIVELVHRTTQLNTTGERPAADELRRCTLYSLSATDRFADYGLVGACVVEGAAIRQLVLSCRVLELGLEDLLLRTAAIDVALDHPRVTGRLIATPRNLPARHLFARSGFAPVAGDPALWAIAASDLAELALPYAIHFEGLPSRQLGSVVSR